MTPFLLAPFRSEKQPAVEDSHARLHRRPKPVFSTEHAATAGHRNPLRSPYHSIFYRSSEDDIVPEYGGGGNVVHGPHSERRALKKHRIAKHVPYSETSSKKPGFPSGHWKRSLLSISRHDAAKSEPPSRSRIPFTMGYARDDWAVENSGHAPVSFLPPHASRPLPPFSPGRL